MLFRSSAAELADHAISAAERRAATNKKVASCQAAAAHMRGIRLNSRSDLEIAVGFYRGGSRTLAHASALEDLGKVALIERDENAAVSFFEAALDRTTEAGADWDSGRLRGRLRSLGRPRKTIADRPKIGWESLTFQEVNVATLAADGQTNRKIGESLFISPHTVNTHMRHVFEKLGVNSRIQLTKFLQGRQM